MNLFAAAIRHQAGGGAVADLDPLVIAPAIAVVPGCSGLIGSIAGDVTLLPQWRSLLRGAREREGRSPAARGQELATDATDGTPRVRTLVSRGWADGAELDLLTKSHSAKSDQLRQQPVIEPCWLLPTARCQFLPLGDVQTMPIDVDWEDRQRHWQRLIPGGRAPCGWPEPGAPLDAAVDFPSELADETPLPEHFQMLRIALEQVESLELRDLPHQRRRRRRDKGLERGVPEFLEGGARSNLISPRPRQSAVTQRLAPSARSSTSRSSSQPAHSPRRSLDRCPLNRGNTNLMDRRVRSFRWQP